MSKSLVAYFSAEAGRTKSIAESLSRKVEADLFEIVPDPPYTAADLRYTNPLARCNREKIGRKDVPVKGKDENWDSFDTVYIGFPIWYDLVQCGRKSAGNGSKPGNGRGTVCLGREGVGDSYGKHHLADHHDSLQSSFHRYWYIRHQA